MIDLTGFPLPTATLLADQLEQTTLIFERQLASELSAVNRLCLHVEQYRGKMLRPTLVLLSGLASGNPPGAASVLGERHRVVAAVAEMIHMATLVHDDVLDEAEIRRRGATVNHLWGNEAAVMLGDYLISNAFHLCSTLGDPSINLALGEVTNTLCEGELMQLHHRDDYGIAEEAYFEIVRRKTSSLIGECCKLGAVLAGADEATTKAMRSFGLALGTAFQIRDDLLDLIGEPSVVGKSLGRDLAKGKLTLPLIRTIACSDQRQRGHILRLLQQQDSEAVREILLSGGAVESTEQTAFDEAQHARECLRQLAPSSARELLEHFAETVVSRTS